MKNYAIHAVWLFVAIATFAFGHFSGKSSSEAEAQAIRERLAPTKSTAARLSDGTSGARAIVGSRERDASDRGSATVLSPEQMGESINSVLAVTDPIERQRRFTELLASLTPENARAAVEALRNAPRSRWNWGQEYSLLTYAWGRLDGPAAVAFAGEVEGRGREWTMGTVLSGWASENPGEARTWVESIEDDDERSRVTRGLISGLAQRDVAAATDYVYSLEQAGASRTGEYMDTIVRQQLSQGLTLATQWTDNLPDGSLKGTALERVANEYVRQDPAQAAEWASQYAEKDFAASAIGEISEEWAEDDPKAALDWAETLTTGDSRNRAVYEAVAEWTEKSPLEAGDYVSALPAGAERDSAASAYAREIVEADPAAAIDWALSIQGEEVRNRTIASTAREWVRRDPAAAKEWIQSNELPPSVVEEINRPNTDRGWRR